MHSHLEAGPLFRNIFFRMFWISVVSLLVIDMVAYWYLTRSLVSQYGQELQEIAVNVSEQVPASIHESLTDRGQIESEDYTLIERYFQWVTQANPIIDDIYTLRPTDDPNVMTFVVSGYETRDDNGDGTIDDTEIKPAIGERYDISELPAMQRGLIEPAADEHVTIDKWGAWLSGYAPLYDADKKVIGLVGVDMDASLLADQRAASLRLILLINAIILPFIVLSAYLQSRLVGRPYRLVAEAMDAASHGDLERRLPVDGSPAMRTLAVLYNNMMGYIQHRLEKLKRDQEEE